MTHGPSTTPPWERTDIVETPDGGVDESAVGAGRTEMTHSPAFANDIGMTASELREQDLSPRRAPAAPTKQTGMDRHPGVGIGPPEEIQGSMPDRPDYASAEPRSPQRPMADDGLRIPGSLTVFVEDPVAPPESRDRPGPAEPRGQRRPLGRPRLPGYRGPRG